MKNYIFLSLLISAFLFSCNTSKKVSKEVEKPKDGIQFTESEKLMPLLDKAKAENKLVFVDFYTTWCLPCKLMEEDVFTDKELGNYMNANYISYKVDAEKGNGVNLASIFKVSVYPTLLFLDTNGKVLERKEGAMYQTEFRDMADSAIQMATDTLPNQ